MLDIQIIRDHPDQIKTAVKNKNYDPKIVDEVLELDKTRRERPQKIESLRAKRNLLTRTDLVKGKQIKTELKTLEPELKEIEEKYKIALNQIPNPASPKAPIGKNETENKEVKKMGRGEKVYFYAKRSPGIGQELRDFRF